MMIKTAIPALWIVVLMTFCAYANGRDGDAETYHVLQKGYIQVDGSTNMFRFSGKSFHQSGKLEQNKSGLYSGHVLVRFDQLDFQIPGIDSVLKDPDYLDTESYPTIEITLDHFDPHQKPSFVEGILTLHNVRKRIRIQVDLTDISPLVKAKGWFNIRQTDFQIRLYKSGFLQVEDLLQISFQLYFCEVHQEMPTDHDLDNPYLQAIVKESGIVILSEPHFYGCQELQNR